MNAALQARIEASVAAQWPAFAREHPALSRAIDQAALQREVTRSLADDPEFQDAFRAAIEANVGVETLANFVDRFVAPALRRLL